jgi:dihydroflavonol-4-reductase
MKEGNVMATLVTGGTGFIGSHLIERLARSGTEVICLAKDAMNMAVLEPLGCRIELVDLNDLRSLDGILDRVDTIYHLAGVTRCRTSEEYYEGNTNATRNFVELCLRASSSVRRFVYVSSLAAAGPSFPGHPLTEDAPYHPVSHYGRSKMLAEREVLKAADRMAVTIVRPSSVYGPRERDMYDYIKLIYRGLEPLIGFKDKLMSLIHVRDLVNGILLAGTAPGAAGKTYFLGSELFYSIREIGETIASVVHTHPVCVRLPHSVVYAVGAVAVAVGKCTGQQVFFTMEKARESVQPAWICSVARAKHDLEYHQTVSLRQGMAETYRWYKEHGWM